MSILDDPYGYNEFLYRPLRIPPHQIVPEKPRPEVRDAVRALVSAHPGWRSAGALRMEVKLRLDYGITASAEQVAGAIAALDA